MPQNRKPYKQPPPSPIEISFWETAKPLIPELQKEIWINNKYRVDFFIPSKKVVIELYGYEHHNTKDQITKDAERERYLQRFGYQVIRFTGTEIYMDVQKCVNEVLLLTNIPIQKPQPNTPQYSVPTSTPYTRKIVQGKAVNLSSLNNPTSHTEKTSFLETWQALVIGVFLVNCLCFLLYIAITYLKIKFP